MNSSLFKLIAFYVKYSRRVIVLGIIVGILAGISSAALVALISVKVARPEATSWLYVAAFCGLVLLDLAAVYVSGVLATSLIQRTNFDMRMRLCRQILDTPLRNLEKAGSSRLLAVLDQDIPTISGGILQIPQLCIHLAVLSGLLLYLGWLSWVMLLLLVGFLVLAIVSIKMVEKRADHLMRLARDEWDTLMGNFQSMTEGVKELKLHRNRRETFFHQILRPSALSYQRYNTTRGKLQAFMSGSIQVLYFFVIGLIIFTLPSIVAGNSRQILTGYALTILYMRGHIMGLLAVIPTLGQATVALRKVQQIGLTLSDTDIDEKAGEPTRISTSWQSLELRGAAHTYHHEKEDENFVLGPLNLTFSPGGLIFVVGGNGSGKTTLAKMLTGLYIPEAGEILLDGEAITETNRDYYRQLFSVVFSDFFIFDQLLGLDDATVDDRAKDYISKLQLDHKVEVKDHKLSTTKLSLGQRKRLALLTAYLEDRPIYVFDEWASGQDPTFKEIFYLKLVPELKARGKTVIIISHDDRYYHLADRLIKLENGQVETDWQVVSESVEVPASIEVV
jgi:putative ATP-binding cassette transporter